MSTERVSTEPLTVHQEIEIHAPVDTVRRFVATREGVRQWFLADEIVLEPHPGGRYEERAVYDGAPHHAIGEVLVYDPPQTFSRTYRAQRADGTYWSADTVVTITLSTLGARTRVVVEHSGFERLPAEYGQRAFEAWTGGWAVAFDRLPTTTLTGNRHRP